MVTTVWGSESRVSTCGAARFAQTAYGRHLGAVRRPGGRGGTMRKTLFVGALVVLLVGAALTVSFAGTRAVVRPMRIAVREHALTDKVINTGKKGDSSGDLLTFHNPIFDSS